ncbi:MAG: acyl carrier protein [Clostridiales bacterium]|nr:acyl carrier protein [Clostridiales bacterium]
MVFEKVAAILAEYKGLEESDIKKESAFKDLGFDSLDVVELIMSFEDEFGVTIEMKEEMKTVGDIVRYIEANK